MHCYLCDKETPEDDDYQADVMGEGIQQFCPECYRIYTGKIKKHWVFYEHGGKHPVLETCMLCGAWCSKEYMINKYMCKGCAQGAKK